MVILILYPPATDWYAATFRPTVQMYSSALNPTEWRLLFIQRHDFTYPHWITARMRTTILQLIASLPPYLSWYRDSPVEYSLAIEVTRVASRHLTSSMDILNENKWKQKEGKGTRTSTSTHTISYCTVLYRTSTWHWYVTSHVPSGNSFLWYSHNLTDIELKVMHVCVLYGLVGVT